MDSLRLPAKLDSLSSFNTFVIEKIDQFDLPREIIPKIELVLEELITNVFKYAYPGREGDLELACSYRGSDLCISLRDWGAPFNPLEQNNPDISEDISQRKIGGLGIYLVKEMVENLEYHRQDDSNILSFCIHTDSTTS